MIERAILLILAAGAVVAGGLIGVWFADTEAPSIVEPLELRLTRYGDQVEMTYCVSVDRRRACPFYVGREGAVDGERIIISGEYRPPQPAPIVIPRTCRSETLSHDLSKARGESLAVSVRISYFCNPLRRIWPIERVIAFGGKRIP